MSSSPRKEAVSGDLSAGLIVGDRYRLERPIASGGMSVVWEATHLALDRPVAVKFLDVFGRRADEARQRFLREARVVAAVRNRHVVDVLDFGTEPGGRPYMVMERLEGVTLAERMERAPALDVAEVIAIVANVLAGLSAVHEAGIVHRDLKPENVFLVDDADGAFPKLLDFGVSRALAPDLESVMPTLDNAIVGTPQFMSPEQARGLRDLDHRSDLWSAGVMLYELLTGVLPYDAEAVGDILVRIATEDAADLTTLRPDLGGPLAAVARKALSRDPDARWASAREMRAALLLAAAETAELLEVPRSGERDIAPLIEQSSLARARSDMPTQDAGLPVPVPRRRARRIAIGIAIGLAIGLVAALAVAGRWGDQQTATIIAAPALTEPAAPPTEPEPSSARALEPPALPVTTSLPPPSSTRPRRARPDHGLLRDPGF